MVCAKCGKSHAADARFCTNCGASIAGSGSEGGSSLTGRLGEIQQDLDETLRSSTAYLTRALQGLSPQPGVLSSGGLNLKGASAAADVQGTKRSPAQPAEFAEVLAPRASQIHQSANFTLSSPFIQENPAYARRISSIQFVYMDHDNQLNAYATDHEVVLEDGTKLKPPVVVFLAGLDAAIRLAATALSTHLALSESRGKKPGSSLLSGTLSRIGEVLRKSGTF